MVKPAVVCDIIGQKLYLARLKTEKATTDSRDAIATDKLLSYLRGCLQLGAIRARPEVIAPCQVE